MSDEDYRELAGILSQLDINDKIELLCIAESMQKEQSIEKRALI